MNSKNQVRIRYEDIVGNGKNVTKHIKNAPFKCD